MVLGFIGLATPNFLRAIIFMFFSLEIGLSVGGLFSPEYMREGWSLGEILNLVQHLPLPVVIVGTAGTAGLIRIMRRQLLDELERQYVITARAKGVREGRLLFKYPVRVAINPMISTVGWLLPTIVSGEVIVSLVLGLPTVGPLLFTALTSEDMFLAATLLPFLNFLTVVDTLISDILLSMVDPTIPLWMALAAALPREWSVIQIYFSIVLILSLVKWGGLARRRHGRRLPGARRACP